MNLLSAARNALKIRTGLPFGETNDDPYRSAITAVLRHYVQLREWTDEYARDNVCHTKCNSCATCRLNSLLDT